MQEKRLQKSIKYLKLIAIIALLMSSIGRSASANGSIVWVATVGGSSSDYGQATVVDGQGNVYVTGYFQGSVDFDPGAGTFVLTSHGNRDIFVVKLSEAGDFLWAIQAGGTQLDAVQGIVLDQSGNIYLTGYFQGTADYDPGPGEYFLTASGLDTFVLKLNPAGAFVWAKAMGSVDSSAGLTIARDLFVDTAGTLYLTGYFYGTTDLDPGTSQYEVTSAGDFDMFIVKLNTDGEFGWGKRVGGSGIDEGTSVALDSAGDILITGRFHDSVDFDPGAGTMTLNSTGDSDIFVLKLHDNGTFSWAKSIGGTLTDESFGVATDSLSNVYITGHIEGTVDVALSSGAVTLTCTGDDSIILLKLNSSGSFVWANKMDGESAFSSDGAGLGLAVDSIDNVYITGYFDGSVDFDPGVGIYNLSSSGEDDIFVAMFDTDGLFRWAQGVGGSGQDEGADIVAFDSDTVTVFVTGRFRGTVDFDSSEGVLEHTSNGLDDLYLLKMNVDGVPNPSQTPIATRTPTATATVSAGSTATSTSTATATVPAGSTATSTPTATPTATATVPAGSTATSTPTATATVPAGSTATSTSTATATIPAGSTATSTPTATATVPAGSTATSTPTATATVPAGSTATSTPTATATAPAGSTATSTPTATATVPAGSTATSTPTATATIPAGSTATSTPTATATVPAGSTATSTPTATATVPAGSTATSTSTATATVPAGSTATSTPTATATVPAGSTATSTSTATATVPAGSTATSTPTATATVPAGSTATSTPTATATVPAGSTATSTPTATATVPAGSTATSTPTATATVPAGSTATSTPTATATVPAGSTATSTPTATATVPAGSTATSTPTATATVPAGSTATSTPTATATVPAGSTATSTPTATATATTTVPAGSTATSTPTVTATPTVPADSTATSTPTATATPTDLPILSENSLYLPLVVR